MKDKDTLLKELSRYVLEMKDDEIIPLAKEYIDNGFDPKEGILEGLVPGMNEAAKLYEQEEYYIPELMGCSAAMYNGLDILRPLIPKEKADVKCKIAIGVVEGDTHDIGKNLVKVMLESAGYEMIDLGRDVPSEKFIDIVKKEKVNIVAMSTLMTTAMSNMKKVVDLLVEKGLRDDVKVIIGGGPISQSFSNKIGADGYSSSAVEAVKLVNKLI